MEYVEEGSVRHVVGDDDGVRGWRWLTGPENRQNVWMRKDPTGTRQKERKRVCKCPFTNANKKKTRKKENNCIVLEQSGLSQMIRNEQIHSWEETPLKKKPIKTRNVLKAAWRKLHVESPCYHIIHICIICGPFKVNLNRTFAPSLSEALSFFATHVRWHVASEYFSIPSTFMCASILKSERELKPTWKHAAKFLQLRPRSHSLNWPPQRFPSFLSN